LRILPGTSSSCVPDWDQAVFPDPDEFGLDRGLRNDVAVWMGIHYCLSAPPSRAMKPA
jgi:cytochrome P450